MCVAAPSNCTGSPYRPSAPVTVEVLVPCRRTSAPATGCPFKVSTTPVKACGPDGSSGEQPDPSTSVPNATALRTGTKSMFALPPSIVALSAMPLGPRAVAAAVETGCPRSNAGPECEGRLSQCLGNPGMQIIHADLASCSGLTGTVVVIDVLRSFTTAPLRIGSISRCLSG